MKIKIDLNDLLKIVIQEISDQVNTHGYLYENILGEIRKGLEEGLKAYAIKDDAATKENRGFTAEATKTDRASILSDVEKIICHDRNNQYGKPENNFYLIAQLWNEYWSSKGKDEFDGSDVAVMMAQLKIARMTTGKFKRDDYIDAIGYLACGCELAAFEED